MPLALLIVATLGCAPCGEAPRPKGAEGATLLSDRAPLPDAGVAPVEKPLRITVEALGESTVLVREEDGWWITSPLRTRADEVAVETVLSALTRGRFRQQLEAAPSPARLAALGLSPPRFRVTATLEDGREIALEGGLEQPFDGTVPMRRSGDPAVYAAGGDVRHALERGADALRARHLLPFETARLRTLEVRTGAQERWTLERRAKDGWTQTLAPPFEADAVFVRRLLHAYANLRAREFSHDGPQVRAARGLDAPVLEARFTPSEGAPVTLRFAAPDEGPAATVWALREEGDTQELVRVEARALTLLQQDREALRSRRLLSFEQAQVARISMTPADGSPAFALVRVPGTGSEAWRLEGARTGPVDRYRAAGLLWTLTSLRADPRPPSDGEPGPVRQGLREVRVLGEGDRALGRLRIGPEDPEAPGLRQVELAGGRRVLVEAARLEALPTSPEALLGPLSDGP